jgi:hypothetical protein
MTILFKLDLHQLLTQGSLKEVCIHKYLGKEAILVIYWVLKDFLGFDLKSFENELE